MTCACGCGAAMKPGQTWQRGHNRNKPLGTYPTPTWDGDCLRWQGPRDPKGYGHIYDTVVHRWVWERFNGPIPAGLTIDHVWSAGCRFRDCMRLTHMEPIPQGDNVRRSATNRERAARTHCPRRHEYTDETVYWEMTPSGNYARKCKPCRAEDARRRRKAKP